MPLSTAAPVRTVSANLNRHDLLAGYWDGNPAFHDQNFCQTAIIQRQLLIDLRIATRIGSAGTVRRQAVDVSPLRRVNQSISLLTVGARESSFRSIKSIAE